MKSLRHIWDPSELVVVIIQLRGDGMDLFAVRVKQGRESALASEAEQFENLAGVTKKFGKKSAYHFHVLGTGVLNRLVNFSPSYRDELIVSGDKEAFYFTSFSDQNRIAVSFVRREAIDGLLKQAGEQKLFVLDITSGYVPLFRLTEGGGKIVFDFTVEQHGSRIELYKKSEEAMERTYIDDKLTALHEALALAISRQYKRPLEGMKLALDETEKEKTGKEYREFRKFRVFGLIIVSVILLLLLASYFYHNSLNDDIAQLEADLTLESENVSVLERLKQEKMRKEQLVSSSGSNSSQFITFYLDHIGESVPREISLVEMTIFPLKEKMKQKRKVELDQGLISIEGLCPDSQTLDRWIDKLEGKDWISRVELLNYLKLNDRQARFNLMIEIVP